MCYIGIVIKYTMGKMMSPVKGDNIFHYFPAKSFVEISQGELVSFVIVKQDLSLHPEIFFF